MKKPGHRPGFFSASRAAEHPVLNLPTIGPLLLRALIVQDMFLAGAIILIYCMLGMIGTIMSDILLAWLDPRIRMEEG